MTKRFFRLTEAAFSRKMNSMKQTFNAKTIRNWLFAVLKGTLVGLAIVIPGVSGGSMLLTIGVYEDAVSITSRDKRVRNAAIVKLIPYAIGIVLGVAALSFVITWLLGNFELYTILLFCGLILGSLPILFRHVTKQKLRVSGPVVALLMVAIMIALPVLGDRTSEQFERLSGTDALSLNERIVLVEADAGEAITVEKTGGTYAVYKVKSPLSGLSGLRANVADGVVFESDTADDVFFTENVTDPTLSADGTLTVDGQVYTVYRAVDTLQNGVPSMLLAGALGFVAAGTMIVPGISGSMVLLVLGYYNSVMTHLKSAIVAALSLNFAALWPHMGVLIPFVIGVALGLLLVSKFIKWLLDKHPTPTYYGIIGLMLASPYAILAKSTVFGASFFADLHWYTVVIGLACLAGGFAVARMLSKRES